MSVGLSLIAGIYVISMLVSGSGSSLTLKGMNEYPGPTCDGCPSVDFNHPYMQTFFMFVGEFACLAVWGAIELYNRLKNKEKKAIPEGKVPYKFWPHVFLFFVPTLCDLLASTLFNIGLYFSQVSIYQMLRNVTVVFVAALSAALWRDYRHKFDLPQGIGLLVLVAGACIISYAAIGFNDQDEAPAKNPALGIVLIICGSLFASLWYVTEEIFLRKVHTVGLLGVSNEGGWGLIIYAILLPIFNAVTDPFTDTTPKPKMEDVKGWFYQVNHSGPLIGLHSAYVFFVLIFNFTGMEITNHVSSAARSTFDACRTILIWIISFAVGWEKWHNISTPVRIVGFAMVTLGVLFYNNVFLLIPFLKQHNIETFGKWMGKGKKAAAPEAGEMPAREIILTETKEKEDGAI